MGLGVRVLRALRAGAHAGARALTDALNDDLQRGLSPVVHRLGSVGEGVEVLSTVRVDAPQNVRMGSFIYVNEGCVLQGHGSLEIGDHSIFGPWVLVMTSMHRYADARLLPYDEVDLMRPVRIGRAVWVGTRATILPGVELGDGCIVGAGAVVTRSFPAGAIIAGNPARAIGQRDPQHFADLERREAFYIREKQRAKLQKIPVKDPRE